MQCFPWNQSKSGPDPKFMEHFKIRIQSKINEIRHSPDPVQSKSSSMLISVAHLCCVSDPWPPLVSWIWLLFLPSHGCYAIMWHCFVFRVLQLDCSCCQEQAVQSLEVVAADWFEMYGIHSDSALAMKSSKSSSTVVLSSCLFRSFVMRFVQKFERM